MDSAINALTNWDRENSNDSQVSVPGSVPVLQNHTNTYLQPHTYNSRHIYRHISTISSPNNVKNNFQVYFQLCYFSFRHIWNYSNNKSFVHSPPFPSGWFCCSWFFVFLFLSSHRTAGLRVSEPERNRYRDVPRMHCSYQGSGFLSNSNHTKFDRISSFLTVSCLQL